MKPFVKSNKNDFLDAEAIAEAVDRHNMRFVPIKTDDQLDLQALHRVRDRLMIRRTSVINQIRAFLLERGMVFAKSPIRLREAIPEVLENANENLTPRMRNLVAMLWSEWKDLELQIVADERRGRAHHASKRCSLHPAASDPGDRAAGRNRDRSFDRQRGSLPEGTSLRPGWVWCRSSTRPVARRSCMGSASAATVICARFWCMGLGRLCCDRSETASRWAHG